MTTQELAHYNQLRDEAKQRAMQLRDEAFDQLWHAIQTVTCKCWRWVCGAVKHALFRPSTGAKAVKTA